MPFVDGKTRVVSLASCNFLSGFPLDLKTIGAWLHQRGVLLCVDAIQTLGAVRCDFSEVDFICADAHKWLLGPNGIAVLWSHKKSREQLRPAVLGWLAPADRDNWFAYDTTPHPTSERFEPGARNFLGAVALDAALKQREEILESCGDNWIEDRVVALRNHTVRVLEVAGCELLWCPDETSKAGIVSFRHAKIDSDELFQKLSEHFALSIRADRDGAQWIRVSASWPNTFSDLDELAKRIS